jgi:putative endonuclease
MVTEKRRLGDLGEELAVRYLKKHHYKILTQHYQKKIGEIDIVAQNKDKTIIFIEVKTRTNQDFGSPQEAVNPLKQHKLIKTAQYYILENHKQDIPWRIDVIAVDLDSKKQIAHIRHFKNAVGEI